jgi:hypothetical protein
MNGFFYPFGIDFRFFRHVSILSTECRCHF